MGSETDGGQARVCVCDKKSNNTLPLNVPYVWSYAFDSFEFEFVKNLIAGDSADTKTSSIITHIFTADTHTCIPAHNAALVDIGRAIAPMRDASRNYRIAANVFFHRKATNRTSDAFA